MLLCNPLNYSLTLSCPGKVCCALVSYIPSASLPAPPWQVSNWPLSCLFGQQCGEGCRLEIKAQLSLLADHETTASICMGPVGLRQESIMLWKGILYPGQARVASVLGPVPQGKMSQRNLLENCSNHSPTCSSFSAIVVKELVTWYSPSQAKQSLGKKCSWSFGTQFWDYIPK